MTGSILVYAGLVAILAGCLSVIKPLAFLRIRSRARGASVLVAGALIAGAGFALPAAEVHVPNAETQLDHFSPVYQFHEFHSIEISAPRDRVYGAIQEVTADEIFLFRTLTAIRRFGRPGPESILNSPERMPLLEVATRTSFLLLAEEPSREIVVGTVVLAPPGWRAKVRPTPEDFRTLRAPGFALATMNFRVEETDAGVCTVTTETRVFATDDSARRRFAGYWRVIYPGSAFIRRMWLRAIKHRAENPKP